MIGFILAFFIIGPILIFYASGYRLDFKRTEYLSFLRLALLGLEAITGSALIALTADAFAFES